MDYMGILKKAWNVTWRYKVLWIFGLFAGAGGGGGNSGGGSSGSSSNTSGSDFFRGADSYPEMWDRVMGQVEPFLPLIIAVVVLLFLVGIVFFVLSFAAQGGLVHLVNEAEEGRPVKAGEGWRKGFQLWGRVFLLDLLIGLPILLLAGALAFIVVLTGIGSAAGFAAGDEGAAAGIAGLGGMCFGILALGLLAAFLGVVLGIAGQLGLRYAVLEDRTALESLKQGWRDLWAKRGGFVMYLVTIVTGIAYGMAVALIAGVLIVPGAIMAVSGNVGPAVFMFMLAGLIAMLPAAIYGTFVSSAWTIFFRRMTGREVVAAVAPAAPASYGAGFPPPPPAAPEFTAPPQAGEYGSAAPPADPWSAANTLPGDVPAAPAPEPAPPAGAWSAEIPAPPEPLPSPDTAPDLAQAGEPDLPGSVPPEGA